MYTPFQPAARDPKGTDVARCCRLLLLCSFFKGQSSLASGSKRLEMECTLGGGASISQLNFEGDSGMLRVFWPSLVQSFWDVVL